MADPETGEAAAAAHVLIYSGGEIMGDGLNKLAFLRAVRRAYPQAHVTWFAGNGSSVYAGKLAPAVDGLIDRVVESDRGAERWRNLLRPRLWPEHFDVILDTQLKLRATAELKRLPHGLMVSGAANGLLSERKAPGQPWQRGRPVHLGRQLLQLLSLARFGRTDGPVDPNGGVRLPAACDAAAKPLLPDGPAVALAPGAGGAVKRWPLASFAALGRRLQSAGYRPAYILGPDETEMHLELAAAVDDAVFPLQAADRAALAHEPFLTMALAKRCRAAVANDSGVGHILAATGIPMVSLYGPTKPEKFAPTNPALICVRAQAFGGSDMASIPIEAVWQALAERLGVLPAPS
jgi:ADP-heptose:LPS heptosyltransferase